MEELMGMGDSGSWARAIVRISPYTFFAIGIAISIGVLILGAAWGIFITGSSLIGVAIKAPRITSKNLIKSAEKEAFEEAKKVRQVQEEEESRPAREEGERRRRDRDRDRRHPHRDRHTEKYQRVTGCLDIWMSTLED